MPQTEPNRFQTFFEEDKYIRFKNYLYNYRLRKMSVEKSFQHERPELVLEEGCGISPLLTRSDRIVYSDLSFTALKILKRTHRRGCYVVADAIHLPFKAGVFSHTVSSEVLEHLEDDQQALKELARVLKPQGRLIVTFPHRRKYFANDDRFVNHFRRYELSEMEHRLKTAGFRPIVIQKVLGPLEKVTMSFVVFCFSVLHHRKSREIKNVRTTKWINVCAPFFNWLNRLYMGPVWLDAMIMPRALSAVLLIDSILSEKPATNNSTITI
jgi:ubiquinone/menaquinone biosynthesis C-methylase UbiE